MDNSFLTDATIIVAIVAGVSSLISALIANLFAVYKDRYNINKPTHNGVLYDQLKHFWVPLHKLLFFGATDNVQSLYKNVHDLLEKEYIYVPTEIVLKVKKTFVVEAGNAIRLREENYRSLQKDVSMAYDIARKKTGYSQIKTGRYAHASKSIANNQETNCSHGFATRQEYKQAEGMLSTEKQNIEFYKILFELTMVPVLLGLFGILMSYFFG